MFRRFLIILLLVVLLGLLVGGLLLVLAYRATQRVPEFYQQAIQTDPKTQVAASDRMLQQTAALVSDVKRKEKWHFLFTAEEMNGWLAVDLPKNHAKALPPDLRDPRVSITPGELTIACQAQRGGIKTVLSLTVEAYVDEPNVVAIRLKKARAGVLPLPLNDVLDQFSAAARRAQVPVQWRQIDGDPVALIRLPPPRDAKDRVIRIEELRLEKDEIYVAGTTTRR